MGRRNTFTMTRQAWERERHMIYHISRQQLADAYTIALEEYGFKPEDFERVNKLVEQAWVEICDICNEDYKDDKAFTYARQKIDDAIKRAVGEENFRPWEVRYG